MSVGKLSPVFLAVSLAIAGPALANTVGKDSGGSQSIDRDQKIGQTKSNSVKDGKGTRNTKSDQISAQTSNEQGARDSQTNQMGFETSAFSLMTPILKRIEAGGNLKGMNPEVVYLIRKYHPLTQTSLAQKNIDLQNIMMPLQQCATAEDPGKASGQAQGTVQAMVDHASGIALYTRLIHNAYVLIGKRYGNIGNSVSMKSVVPNAQRVVAEALIEASNMEMGDTQCKARYFFQASAVAQARTQYVSIRNQVQNINNQQSAGAFVGMAVGGLGGGGKILGTMAQWDAQAKQAGLMMNTLDSPVACPVAVVMNCDLPVGQAQVAIDQDQLMVAGAPQWGGDQGMVMGVRLTLSETRSLEKHISASDTDSQTKSRSRESYVSKDTDTSSSSSRDMSFSRKTSTSSGTKANIDVSASGFK